MSITIGDKPEQNVINVGDEISSNALAAISGASSPSSSNVFATRNSIFSTANTFSYPQLFEVLNNTSPALRVNSGSTVSVSPLTGAFYVSVLNSSTLGPAVVVENRGLGDCIRIHDTNAPDSTLFKIDNAGGVYLGGSLTLASGSFSSTTAITIDNTNYPHEILVKVGSTTYAIPARAI